jgi:cation transporter-like permease
MKGIVIVDDIVDVVQEAATEDAQKFGGVEVLDLPDLQSTRREMFRKRGRWLTILLVGEMLTATALGFFEEDLIPVLALFLPLIISSGGNSGSQASTLVVRAMALGEVRTRDWWLVLRREAAIGLALGALLGGCASVRVLLWGAAGSYGEHWFMIGITVACSVTGCVLWGTLAGSMLPFVLRRFGADPANASAPLVATLVDVSGIIIYFTIAKLLPSAVTPVLHQEASALPQHLLRSLHLGGELRLVRKCRPVLRGHDLVGEILERVVGHGRILFRTQDESDRWVFAGHGPVLARVVQVQVHLSRVGVRELAELEIDDDQAAQAPVIEEQIHPIPGVADAKPALTPDEREVPAEF